VLTDEVLLCLGDSVYGGAPGDSTVILRELLAQQQQLVEAGEVGESCARQLGQDDDDAEHVLSQCPMCSLTLN
jgi:hypothetical protein